MMNNLPPSSFPFDTQLLVDICRQYDVGMVALFGSMARDSTNEASDIDLLVRFNKPTGLIQTIMLEQQLQQALGRKIDLLTEGSVSPYLRSSIYQDVRVLYEQQ